MPKICIHRLGNRGSPFRRRRIRFSYLVDVFQDVLFDNYHEHMAYHAVGPLQRFFTRIGLELFSAERVSSHGGSLRGFAVSARIGRHRRGPDRGGKMGLDRSATLREFGDRIDRLRDRFKACRNSGTPEIPLTVRPQKRPRCFITSASNWHAGLHHRRQPAEAIVQSRTAHTGRFQRGRPAGYSGDPRLELCRRYRRTTPLRRKVLYRMSS